MGLVRTQRELIDTAVSGRQGVKHQEINYGREDAEKHVASGIWRIKESTRVKHKQSSPVLALVSQTMF